MSTLLEREHGPEIRSWAATGNGFGIVAGTGTGKTLGVRPIAEEILQASLSVGVVNREREATPDTPNWNVIIVTTGIARRWFEDALITGRDTLIVDEIHQTSAELELCLALGKRAGCRFIWLSATVDPAFYSRYLDSAEVLITSAFDPKLRARVTVVPRRVEEFLDARFLRRVIKERRGVAVFVPTRAEVEQLAAGLGEQWRGLTTAFYHGGEPIRVIRPFLEGEVEHPWLLAMTAAGQSALNLPGLNTVIIYDARYGIVIDRGRNVLHRLYLGANEILQMAGRVHGRVPAGEVAILSDRDLVFDALRPGPPEFQLAGDAERVALTCASLGVDAQELDLPVPLERSAYRSALKLLTTRGLVWESRLTAYGREVDALPVERPWGEMLVHAGEELIPVVATIANIDSLHRMTRDERNLHGLVVDGSDHLTTYNIYAQALNQYGAVGSVYGLPRHLFDEGLDEWAEERGVLVKAIEDTALGMAAVYRSLELPLPKQLPYASKDLKHRFIDLLARVGSLDVVIDELTVDGQEARVSRNSMAGSWGAVLGSLRYFADRYGQPRASIEGTTLPYDLIRRHAQLGPPLVSVTGPRKRQRLMVSRRLGYFGFELETEVSPLPDPFPDELSTAARDALTEALFAGRTPHPDQGAIRRAAHDLSELYRRSGGELSQIAPSRIRRLVRERLDRVADWRSFLETPLRLDLDSLVEQGVRRQLSALPSKVKLLGDAVAMDYEVEDGSGVVRLRLGEKQARRLQESDLPDVGRPIRFVVVRGQRPALRADSLGELRAKLREDVESGRLRKQGSARAKENPPRGRRGRRRRPR
ncbi:MAG: DEAD/DEAH box helicase [Gemmatimonadales bacterium]|nr:DEAD/DEAH box helicase [Gemmatimonadales bacterium]